MDIRSHTRIAERPNKDGIEIAIQHRKTIGRNRNAVGKKTVRTPIEFRELNGRSGGLHHPQGLRNDLTANPIPRKDCDTFNAHGWQGNIPRVPLAFREKAS
jgi:hypothetical protein